MTKLSEQELAQIDALDEQLVTYKMRNDERAFSAPIGGLMPMMDPPAPELIAAAVRLHDMLTRANIPAPELRQFIGDPSSRVKNVIVELREIERMNQR